MCEDPSNYYFSALQAGLQSRVIVAPLPASIRPWQAVFLQSGSLTIERHETQEQADHQTIESPALICCPSGSAAQLSLSAGSTGIHLALGEMFLVAVLGRRPEAIEIREAVLNFVILPLEINSDAARRIQSILDEIVFEQSRSSAGQLLVIEAQIRCLLVHLWRHTQQIDDAVQSAGQSTVILRRFRHLVETNFHSRWRVSEYADALNITTDRLHDVATRILGLTPLELIHDRTCREAKSLLARSNMTLDQIAAQLGFKSSPQFSAFFRNREGLPPAKFRKLVAANSDRTSIGEKVDFSDWP
jgi:AraC family transcriptional activator of pobA